LKSLQNLFAFMALSQVREFRKEEEISDCIAFFLEIIVSTGKILATSKTIVFRTTSTAGLSRISSAFIG
jgi:hypothetical protein